LTLDAKADAAKPKPRVAEKFEIENRTQVSFLFSRFTLGVCENAYKSGLYLLALSCWVLSEKKTANLKDVELRIIAELMKNSRRSDRELAHAVGVSQPTCGRIRKRLEKEGIIKEYTMIPDFRRLGYQMMGVTFIRKEETVKKEERAELRKAVTELEKKNPYASLMAVNGMGLGKGRMFITLYRSYGGYSEAMQSTKSLPHVDAEGVESFLVDLNDESNYRLLTLQQVARNIQASGKVSTEESAKKERIEGFSKD